MQTCARFHSCGNMSLHDKLAYAAMNGFNQLRVFMDYINL